MQQGVALVVALILLQGPLGLLMAGMPNSPDKIRAYALHKSIGLTILALAVLRLAWRIFDRRPHDPPGMPNWQRRTAHITHWLLYVLIFAVPLSGWLFDSATGLRPLHWWNTITMPSLTGGPAPDWADFTRSLHHYLFWLLVAVVVGHVAAALKHHFIDRDNVLRRMLPWGRLRSGDSSS